jgi:hypothetical protein
LSTQAAYGGDKFPPELLKCVVFLGYKDQDGKHHLVGSGFWLSRAGPADLTDQYRPSYLATAAHVIEKIRNKAADCRVWVRVNLKGGGQEWHETPLTCWARHPDAAVDIALMKVGISPDCDHVAWPVERCVTNDSLDSPETGDRRVELGDELCFAGLFYPHAGAGKNIPIVRIGTVAAMRGEPVTNRDGMPMDAYLVEAQSIGGLSGSPVFMDIITAKTTLPPSYGYTARAYEYKSVLRFKLFGLVHGHFGEDLAEDAVVDDGNEKIHVNMGIAMVIPAEKVLGVVEQFLVEEQIEIEEARQRKLATVSVRVGGADKPQPNVTFGITIFELPKNAS